jgi:hypothetical protein
MREGIDLEIGSLDPLCQGDSLLKVPVGVFDPGCPQLGDAEVDQRERAEILAKSKLGGVRGLRRGEQSLGFIDDGREVAALTGDRQPQNREQHLQAFAPARGPGDRLPDCERKLVLALLERSPVQLIGRHQRGELSIGRDHLSGESGQELVRGGGLAIEDKGKPVIGEHAGSQAPVLCHLGMADCLNGVLVIGKPPGGKSVQRTQLRRLGAP